MEDKVRATIARHDMFKPTDKIMVAVSGGKDSLSLLNILAKIEKAFPKTSLCAVTVDEGIKGYRDEALKFAVGNCRKLGINSVVTSFKHLYGFSLDEIVKMTLEKGEPDKGLTPCAYCGVLRRRALNLAARDSSADRLATGHNLDDEAQTILLNILHGDALRIARVKPVLEDVHPKFVQRVKPMCKLPEKEIAFYTHMKRIEYQSVPCPYAPTALRSDIRLMLNRIEEKHAGTKFTLTKSVERIRPALEAVTEEAKLQDCIECGEPTAGKICQPCQMLRKLGIH
jgi:uncharacterized protein (TIGR00269 family)